MDSETYKDFWARIDIDICPYTKHMTKLYGYDRNFKHS